MKKFIVLILVLLFAGCATTGDMAKLEQKVADLEEMALMGGTEGAGASFYPFTAGLTGGEAGKLDKITSLADKDVAFGVLQDDGTYGNAFLAYTHDSGASAGDVLPYSVDSGDAGTDWELCKGIFNGVWAFDDIRMTDTKSITNEADGADDYFSLEATDDVGDSPVQIAGLRVINSADAASTQAILGNINSRAIIELDATADQMANESYSGIVITGLNAGEGIFQGNLVYWDATAVEWMAADADDPGHFPARGVALGTGSNGNPLDVLVQGVMRHDDWAAVFTVGGPVFLSDDPTDNDGVAVTAPSTENDCVQVVGWALTVDEVYFNFLGHWLLVAAP